jgi:predicted phosphodiesterase
MRIAVIADTHDRYPADLPAKLARADEIWHLGDVCDPAVLGAFDSLGPPLLVVRGNNDQDADWPLTLDLEREGVRFHLIHIPPDWAPPHCHAVLHGHTHVPRDQRIDGVRWLNPGCVSRPNRGSPPSFAWLTVKNGKIARWEWVRL